MDVTLTFATLDLPGATETADRLAVMAPALEEVDALSRDEIPDARASALARA